MRRGRAIPYLLILPALMTLLLLFVYPIFWNSYLSLHNVQFATFMEEWPFVGLENYQMLIRDTIFPGRFQKSLVVSLQFVVGSIVGQFVLGLGLALALNSKIKGRHLFRLLIALPWILSELVVAYIWLYLYQPSGTINDLLNTVGLPTVRWLSSSGSAIWALVLTNIWEEKFEEEHPDIDLQVDAQFLPFADRLRQLRAAATAGTPLDIVSLDQPEVGDFASAGFTTNLTEWINRDLDGLASYLPAHREATKFQGDWHAIWIFTDARLLWYWQDLVDEAGVDPATDMRTWDSYIENCQALDETLGDVEGCLLIGQAWVADWTMPYAWMQGGDLGFSANPDLAEEQGAADPWIPTFNTDAWVNALQFTRDQVDAGIDPFTEHQFGQTFIARRYATWLGGTWVYGVAQEADVDLSQLKIVGAFPVPEEGTDTATMAGGWSLAIPSTSEQPEMAWEFMKAMVDEEILGEMQVRFGELPTQETIAENKADEFAEFWNEGGVDRWAEIQELAPHAYGRPSFPTWPQVAAAITDMVQRVMFENTDPQEAAETAQRTTITEVLGWPEGTTVTLHDDADGSCEHADVDWLFSTVTPGQQAADENGNGDVCSHVELP